MAERVARLGFAVSFCFVQVRHSQFDRLLSTGITSEGEEKFVQYMRRTRMLNEKEIKKIIRDFKEIISVKKYGIVLRFLMFFEELVLMKRLFLPKK